LVITVVKSRPCQGRTNTTTFSQPLEV